MYIYTGTVFACQNIFGKIAAGVARDGVTRQRRLPDWPAGQGCGGKGQLLDTLQCAVDGWIFGHKDVTYQQAPFLGS